MTQMQVDFQKASEIERSNRAKESVLRDQAETARMEAKNRERQTKLQEEMAGYEKFNKVASGLGNLGKGVGALINPATSVVNAGTAAETAIKTALIRQGY